MDDLSLLFRLKADNAQAKATLADTRQAVAQLRQSFGPQLTQTISVANKSFSDLGGNLNGFVSRHLPLFGGSVQRVTDTLRTLGSEGPKTEKAISGIARSIESIASQSGKSTSQIATFLTSFVQIEGQSKRNSAAVEFFGASMAQKLLPQLEKTGAAVGAVSGEAAAMGTSLAALAGPIGVIVIALAALTAGVVLVTNKLVDLTVQTAEYQGQLFDLSQQTGVSVEILNALEIALSKVGGNLGSATQSLITFQRQLDEAQDVSSKAGQTFARLGISTTDTETAFREALKALARMPEGFTQTNAAAELFGSRGGKQILAVLKELHGDIDAAVSDLGDLAKVTTAQAKQADEFNDALRDLQILLRGASAVLVREVIPSATAALKDLQGLLKENEAAFRAIGAAVDIATTALGSFLRNGLTGLRLFLATHRAEFEITAAIFERIAAALKTIRGTEAAEPLKGALDGLKLLQDAQEAFNKGLKPFDLKEIFGVDDKTIKAGKDALDAQLDTLQDAIGIRNQRFQDETESVKRELQKRSIEFDAYYRQQKERNEQQLRETLASLQTEREAVQRALAQKFIDANEAAEKQRRIDAQAREAKRAADREQQRLDDERAAFKRKQDQATIDIQRATVETQLRILAAGDDRRIASIRALADLRVKTEEDAERQILQIRLAAIDREKAIVESEIKLLERLRDQKAGDPEENLKQLARLNLQLRVLTEERTTVAVQGEREIEEGRQVDLRNEREYADDLKEIKARIRDIERDTAEDVIRLMVLSFASRKDIIRAQRDQALRDEDDRHRRETEIIDQQKQETDEQIKVLEGYLKNLKIGTTEEIAEHDRLKESLEALRIKRAELEAQQEKENDRNKTRKRRVTTEANKQEALAGPGGGFDFGLETGQLKTLEEGVKSFQDVATVAFSAVGAMVNQLAAGIGNLVQNFVLLGSNGPNAFRKLVASVLAGVAAQAATLAIMELAYGIAALTPWGAAVYGPAPLHFKSAALFGSIAAVTAVAGRGLAGGLFQSGSGTGTNGSGAGEQKDLNPLSLARNAGPGAPQQIAPQIQPIRLVIEHRVDDSKFGKAITSHVVEDINNAGPIREVISGDGNLNRG